MELESKEISTISIPTSDRIDELTIDNSARLLYVFESSFSLHATPPSQTHVHKLDLTTGEIVRTYKGLDLTGVASASVDEETGDVFVSSAKNIERIVLPLVGDPVITTYVT